MSAESNVEQSFTVWERLLNQYPFKLDSLVVFSWFVWWYMFVTAPSKPVRSIVKLTTLKSKILTIVPKVNKYLFQQCFTQVIVIDNFSQLQQNYHPHTTETIQRPTAPKSRQRTRRCFSRQDGSFKIELNDTRRKKNDFPTKTIHADVNILY